MFLITVLDINTDVTAQIWLFKTAGRGMTAPLHLHKADVRVGWATDGWREVSKNNLSEVSSALNDPMFHFNHVDSMIPLQEESGCRFDLITEVWSEILMASNVLNVRVPAWLRALHGQTWSVCTSTSPHKALEIQVRVLNVSDRAAS